MADIKSVPIVGYENYSITSNGDVFNGDRLKSKIKTKSGHIAVSLWKNNKEYREYIHRLMLMHFVGMPEKGQEALHNNGDPSDNRIENLRWGTRSENVQDAIKHGTATVGSKNGGAKLTLNDVLFIRDMKDMGFRQYEVLRHFKVSQITISRLFNGKTYKRELSGCM